MSRIRNALPSEAGTWVLLATCTAQAMVVLDVSVVNVALPSIQHSLDVTAAALPWVVNAYTVLFAALLLLGGRLLDVIDTKKAFVGSLAAFTVASLTCGLAPTAGVLVAARAGQGASAAVLAPATMAMLTTTFAAGAARARAMSIWGAVGAAGGAAGMLVGGLLVQLLTWRWIFLINVPVGLGVAVAAVRTLGSGSSPERRGRLDLAGGCLACLGLLAVVYGLTRAGGDGRLAPQSWVPMVSGLLVLVAFVWVETRVRNPLVPPRLFADRALSVGVVSVALLGSAMLPMWYFVTLYVQNILHCSPLAAGLAFVPMATVLGVFSRVAGRLAHAYGPRIVAVVGLLLTGGGVALFGRVPEAGDYLTDVLPAMLVAAAGLGCGYVALTLVISDALPDADAGLGAGLANAARQIGGGLGLAALATVAATARGENTRSHQSAVLTGYRVAFLLAAAAAVLGAFIVLLLPRRGPDRQVRKRADEALEGGTVRRGAAMSDRTVPDASDRACRG